MRSLTSSLNKAAMPPVLLLLLSLLGLLSLTKLTLSSLYYAYAFFLRPAKDLKAHYGSWAVVTGPTQGIGQAMAFELARKNLNLILIGRNPKKLEAVGTAIREEHSTDVKVVVIDFAGDLSVGLKELEETVAGLDVGVLVNNAGVSNRRAKYFGEGGVEEWMEVVGVNLGALTEVTRVVSKGMVERERGAVVNIGSGASVVVPSFPLFSVYAGTKAYVQQLSKSMHVEYKSKGVHVQCQAPLYVHTRMAARAEGYYFFKPSPESYAKAAVHWIGYDSVCVPYFPHFLQWCLANMLPDFINDYMRLTTNMGFLKKST